MANKRITTAELDFDGIKSNLKTYLQGQAEFADYDFEGSALSVLLDVLAYNTHYNALYTNLAVNESFLDSATKRDSVVSLAKNLGYRPRSAIAPTAVITVNVTSPTSTPTTLSLPKNTPFTTTIDGTTYTFYTTAEHTTTISSGSYSFVGVTLKEGTVLSFKYTVAAGQRYIIPNTGCDLSTLTVRVQENASSGTYTTYTEGANLIDITPTSEVYFVKEIDNQLYEIEFGDGTIGAALSNGNVVTLDYMVTNKDAANGARLFTYGGDSLAGGVVTATTTTVAAGGGDIESVESIRFNAPRHFSTQNRGVTVEDYKSLVLENYPGIEAINAWGGEDNDPPIYGKVFLSVKPQNANALTAAQKTDIIDNILKPRNIVSITPEIIDPDYINIQVDTAVYYNPRFTTRSSEDLKTLVTSTISTYNTTDLEQFDSIFRASKISRLIDATEPSIVSNITTVTLHKPITPLFNTDAQYEINIVNPIYTEGVDEGIITSTGFYISGDTENIYYLRDDGVGNIKLYYLTSGNVIVYTNEAFGTVDYANGSITIPSLNITSLEGSEFKLIIKPSSYDVVSVRNQIARVLDELVTVTMIVDNISLGNAGGGLNHTFTASR